MTLAELKADKRWFLWNYSPGKSNEGSYVSYGWQDRNK